MNEIITIQTQHNSVKISPTSLDLTENLSINDYMELGGKINSLHKSTPWLLADLLGYGEEKYGDQFSQIVDDWGYKSETLRNALYVSSRWPKDRRRPELTFAHHQSIASINPEIADKMLQIAVDKGLSVSELRVLKREYQKELSGEKDQEEEIKESRCPNCNFILE